jgi:hypothetical protein
LYFNEGERKNLMLILQVLKYFTEILEKIRIPYILTGSVAFNFYAIPRSTRDIDMDYISKWVETLRLNTFGLLP